MSAKTFDIAGLYVSEQRRLQQLIRRLVGNWATTDDLVQQAFTKLVAAADTGNLDNCPAYLMTTARNLALNHLRDLKRHGEVGIPDAELHAIPDGRPSPEMTAIYRCELRRVLQAVASLPIKRREAFVLNKFEGMGYDEIAARQGISRNTVISHIVLALAELDRKIGRY
ncbi:RNA polymerase sigma-70 factor (ECF subfamily) [Rhizobium sp. ERR 1071]|uniref:RNA polymerase sigma factor n=1 Tax=Rhizobium sp. ERR 1071 TaxID=2572677 RepID=UPI001199B38F|nr:sigma-70 family RNA polymerase sigma factor [Rhizobium sp. ERR1071]TWB12211.1 RNA polymerase sigma-70 factor (ECF subfamily) [Rhizobium sp. ERR1071]